VCTVWSDWQMNVPRAARNANCPDDGVILRAKGLQKSYGGQAVLARVDLELRRGDVVLLRGDNGSGKTTLLNILTGYLEPDAGSIHLQANGIKQVLEFPRLWWSKLNPFSRFAPERLVRAGVGRSWQDMRLFPSLNLLENVIAAVPGQNGENPVWAVVARRSVRRQEMANQRAAGEMLAELGLAGRETSSADCVSLGQAKRVAIARAVQAGAEILFLDEPFAGLDADGIEHVLDLLRTLVEKRGVTLVIVEHVFHTKRLLSFANTVWTLAAGNLTVHSPASLEEEGKAGSDGVDQWLNGLLDQDRTRHDLDLPGGARLTTIRPRAQRCVPPLLEMNDIVVKRAGRAVVGRDGGLSFCLQQGDLAVLQAPNGWGKTTLLESLAGLLPLSRGTVRLSGRPLGEIRPWEGPRRELALLQSRGRYFPNLTVGECFRLSGADRFPDELGSLLNRKMGTLSGGERQSVALRSILGRNSTRLLLLDEPFAMLDREAISRACRLLAQASCEGILMVVPARSSLTTRDTIKTGIDLMASPSR
jgi:ABC-type branched-subunit amino acid transport system ATPase component